MRPSSTIAAAALACTLIGSTTLSAQSDDRQAAAPAKHGWEFLVPTGSVIPTGAQRDAIKRGNLTAVQLTYVARPSLAVTATAGWARSRDLASADTPKLDLFTYDVGVEARTARWALGRGTTLRSFAGLGAGARTYDYRSLDVDATHNVATYVAAGSELGVRRIRLRLEARDYVAGFKALDGAGASHVRNDVVVMAGLRLVRR